MQHRPYDLWAAREVVDLISEARVFKPHLKAAFVINHRIVNTAIGRDGAAALEEYPIPGLAAGVSQRGDFATSAATGATVLEIDPPGRAGREIAALADELLRRE